LPPEFETLKAELGDLARSDEDVLTYALFPKVGKEFLLKKNGQWQKPSEIVKIFATVK
jgi:oxaloacetate decarboxylase alpha subunit